MAMVCPKCKEWFGLVELMGVKVEDLTDLILYIRHFPDGIGFAMYDYFGKDGTTHKFMYGLLEILLKVAGKERPKTLKEIEERIKLSDGDPKRYIELLEKEMKESLESD